MTIGAMPPAEISIEPALVRALLAEQHPDISRLPLIDLGSGWDNRLYRVGEHLVVRLPRRAAAAALIEHEQRWLPELAPRLPLPIPVPLRIGRPGCGFPWSWSVVPWLAGENAAIVPPDDLERAAVDLGAFVRAMHQPAPAEAPGNPVRGVPLAYRTRAVHDRATQLDGVVDGAAVRALWDGAVRTPAWPGPPLWIHGDFHPGNLLVAAGHLSAVIDFGDLTAGDPATDLSIAWMLLPSAMRAHFRASARGSNDRIDDDTWMRARGWALALGLAYLASSRDNDMMGMLGRTTIAAALGDGP
jgi:aminoglycoside phosphotransferase (APT) family kinase protein